jgi:hypothetical protein
MLGTTAVAAASGAAPVLDCGNGGPYGRVPAIDEHGALYLEKAP